MAPGRVLELLPAKVKTLPLLTKFYVIYNSRTFLCRLCIFVDYSKPHQRRDEVGTGGYGGTRPEG